MFVRGKKWQEPRSPRNPSVHDVDFTSLQVKERGNDALDGSILDFRAI